MELNIIEKKKKHFLNDWNKITVYDTNKLFLAMFISVFIPLPMFIYVSVIVCIVVYYISYYFFHNYKIIGTIRIEDKKIIVNTNIEDKEIYFDSLEGFIMTYKTWTKRMINKNKQTDFNWIYIKTRDYSLKLNYVFTSNSNFYDCLDLIEEKQKENEVLKIFNLANVEIDDLINLKNKI